MQQLHHPMLYPLYPKVTVYIQQKHILYTQLFRYWMGMISHGKSCERLKEIMVQGGVTGHQFYIMASWNSKQPVFFMVVSIGWWTKPLHKKNGCFTKHPLKTWLFRVPGLYLWVLLRWFPPWGKSQIEVQPLVESKSPWEMVVVDLLGGIVVFLGFHTKDTHHTLMSVYIYICMFMTG